MLQVLARSASTEPNLTSHDVDNPTAARPAPHSNTDSPPTAHQGRSLHYCIGTRSDKTHSKAPPVQQAAGQDQEPEGRARRVQVRTTSEALH